MKIQLINQTFYPDSSATAQVLTTFAQSLVRAGHQVTVITSCRGYLDPGARYPVRENWNGIDIVRVDAPKIGGDSRAARIANAALLNLAFAMALFRSARPDIAIVLTSPPLIGCIAAAAGPRPSRALIYWVMDLNPDQAIAAGWITERSLLARLIRRALRFAFGRADSIVVLDRFMQERVERYPEARGKVQVVPLWCEESLHPVEKSINPFIERHNLRGKYVVMYSGNMSLCHSLDTVIGAAEKLRGDPGVAFVLIGDGARRREVAEAACRDGLGNVIMLPYQSREQLSNSLSAADLHVVTMGPEYIGIVHPSKVYGIIGVERPFVFIGPERSFINEELVDRGAGKRLAHGDSDGLVELIRGMRAAEGDTRDAARALHELAEAFALERIIERWRAILPHDEEQGPPNSSMSA